MLSKYCGINANMASDDEFDSCLAKVGGIIEGAFLRYGLEIGRKLGLFRAMSSFQEPKTCQEIADHLKLKERYVREWLGAMVCARILCLDDSGEKYYVSKAMAQVLASPILQWEQAVGALDVTDEILHCFQPHGPTGLPYSKYSKFTSWMETYKVDKVKAHISTDFPDAVPGLRQKLESGITVCDMGCGCGLVSRLLAKAFPNSTFYGFDIDSGAVSRARAAAEREGVGAPRCQFSVGNAESLPAEWGGAFAVVTAFDAVHDQARPAAGLRECRRILRPAGGELVVLDVKAHTAHGDNVEEREFTVRDPALSPATFYMVSLLRCLPLSLHVADGAGLGACWGKERATAMLRGAGFPRVRVVEPLYDPSTLIYICSLE